MFPWIGTLPTKCNPFIGRHAIARIGTLDKFVCGLLHTCRCLVKCKRVLLVAPLHNENCLVGKCIVPASRHLEHVCINKGSLLVGEGHLVILSPYARTPRRLKKVPAAYTSVSGQFQKTSRNTLTKTKVWWNGLVHILVRIALSLACPRVKSAPGFQHFFIIIIIAKHVAVIEFPKVP